MRNRFTVLAMATALAGCASRNIGTSALGRGGGPAAVQITLIGFNDFHGNLEPPRQSIEVPGTGPDEKIKVPAGGAAYFASAVNALRARNPNHLVLSAGDMVGASPLISSLFLDEPTIHAMNLIGVDYSAAGNHEFDRGRAELLRLDSGGCEQHTARQPCAVDPAFEGARFGILAANTITETGQPLLPAYAIRSFGSGSRRVDIGIIGLTLEGTPALVTPTGVAGLTFRDEADTINALVPRLKAEGADVIVVLIHEGADGRVPLGDSSCEGLSGDIMPILQRLSPSVDIVISGHTHNSYICDYRNIDPQRPFLLTSAGRYGTMLTEISLTVDPRSGRLLSRAAVQNIVQSEGFTASAGAVAPTDAVPRYSPDPEVAAVVDRYRSASAAAASRVIGRLSASATTKATDSREQILGNLIADAQLAATRQSGAQIAFMNPGGVRAEIVPAANGRVTFGQIYATQPFGNTMVVKSFTGAQIKALLEQQFASGSNSVDQPNVLLPSAGFTYSYDLSRPAGQRVIHPRLNSQLLEDARSYRVTMNSFLASGGDNFTLFREGVDQTGGPLDLDVLEDYFAANPALALPATDRITDLTPE